MCVCVCVCVCVCGWVGASSVHVLSEGGKPDLFFSDPGMKLDEPCKNARLCDVPRESRILVYG